jgi:tetratricopeptide (TPR) repeat protein
MRKTITATMLALFVCAFAFAQTNGDNIKDEKVVKDNNADLKVSLLSVARNSSCDCIGKIKFNKKSQEKVSKEIKKCIDDQVSSYQLGMKLFGSMAAISDGKDKTITINTNTASNEYSEYYYEIERAVRDSCEAVKTAVASHNKETKHSVSDDDDAKAYYNIGQDAMQAEKYEDAVKYFRKAVKKDEKFAFAWDNLGVCLRKLEKYDEALEAYNKSLAIDPKGATALQNIPVVYQVQNKFDEALESYKKLIAIYPKDPEGYFGAGQTLLKYKEPKLESGLDYMCKAYNLYIALGSPYRVDAENIISALFGALKQEGKEAVFNRILKENNITQISK